MKGRDVGRSGIDTYLPQPAEAYIGGVGSTMYQLKSTTIQGGALGDISPYPEREENGLGMPTSTPQDQRFRYHPSNTFHNQRMTSRSSRRDAWEYEYPHPTPHPYKINFMHRRTHLYKK